MQSSAIVQTTSRPKRVAFLVNPTNIDFSAINSIIRFNVRSWGGRYNAIFPTDGKNMSPDWWQALIFHDPDIIYSLVNLDIAFKEKIDRYILPAKIIELDVRERQVLKDPHHIVNDFDIGAVDILGIPSYLKRKRSAQDGPFFLIPTFSYGNGPNIDFIVRNFGALSADIGTENTFNAVEHELVDIAKCTINDFLRKFLAKGSKCITPIDLCKMFSTAPIPIKYESFSRGFHLIVGDSIYDIIYASNRPMQLDYEPGRATMWISEKTLDDDEAITLVTKWIGSVFWGDGNNRYGKILSHSVLPEKLERLKDKLGKEIHLFFDINKIPEDKSFFPAISWQKYGGLLERKPVYQDQIVLNQGKGLIEFPKLEFLQDRHPQTGWMVECEISRTLADVVHTPALFWTFPKKLGISDTVFPYRADTRITSLGLPAAFVSCPENKIQIQIPHIESLVWQYFDKTKANFRYKTKEKPKFQEFKISEQGKAIRGLIQLFGGLNQCGRYFEDHYWREIFSYMSGNPEYDFTDRKSKFRMELEEFFAEKPEPLNKEHGHFEDLISHLARKPLYRSPLDRSMSYADFKDYFGKLKKESIDQKIEKNYWKHKRFEDVEEYEFTDLVQMGVLRQGIEIPCRCGSKCWYSVGEIEAEVTCKGCFAKNSLPINPSWSYKLNDLVRDGLRLKGVLAVLQALGTLNQFSSYSLLYLPCQDLYLSDSGKKFTDLDLIMIKEKKFIIGEVKTEISDFDEKDFTKMAEVAEEIKPDILIFAVPWKENVAWPITFIEKIKNISERLNPSGIEVLPLALTWSSSKGIPKSLLSREIF